MKHLNNGIITSKKVIVRSSEFLENIQLEYWRNGVLECCKIRKLFIESLLHHSSTPILQEYSQLKDSLKDSHVNT